MCNIEVLCTSPFITAETLKRVLKALKAKPSVDSLVEVQKRKQYTWSRGGPEYGDGRIPNSVDLPVTVIESVGLYMVRRQPGQLAPSRRFGAKSIMFEITDEEAMDVNWLEDLELAERICAGHRAVHSAALDAIRPHLCASRLADICKERRLKGLLPAGFPRVSDLSV